MVGIMIGINSMRFYCVYHDWYQFWSIMDLKFYEIKGQTNTYYRKQIIFN
jgi:hypothetical protein